MQNASPTRLKVGLLVDGPANSKYVKGLVEWARTDGRVSVTHLLVQKMDGQRRPRRFDPSGIARMLGNRLWRAAIALERRLLRKTRAHRDHFERFDLRTLVPNVVELSPRVSPSGLVHRFSPTDVQAVRELGLDVILRCGSGILRGDILTAARHGILSFHHGDNRINRGTPPAFWEWYHRWPATGFVIQQLTEELDGGNVLVRGNFQTQDHFVLNQAHLYTKANEHLKALLAHIALTGTLPAAEEPVPYCAHLYRQPGLREMCSYWGKLVWRAAQRRWMRMRGLEERWGIAYAFSDWRRLVLWKAIRPVVPPGRFLADPFLWEHEGRTYCFVEDYVYRTQRGRISVFALDADGATDLGVCLDEPFHLSFPYLFDYEGQLYMCPETAKSGQIRVYRCVDFPLRWELAAVLMDGVSATDCMLFPHAGKWWMLTNIDGSTAGDHCAELYLFHADSPLSNDWTAHPSNPLRIDSEGGRNAGLVRESGRIYRMGQRQGYANYGAGLMVHEIVTLNESRYEERLVCRMDGDFDAANIHGLHHMSSTGRVTVFDYKAYGRTDVAMGTERDRPHAISGRSKTIDTSRALGRPTAR